ncbi:hypothetical protein M514_15199 [Trichuris suis]|uniref:Serpin domain-containing protein n=1 Tax=Trichuris suis TaxID=68888 RepID=A0A085NTJ9_9BILA|nr:hypothetical protein M514_15199 [Trichuris suis]
MDILPEFRKRIQEEYSADIELLHFGKSEEACRRINSWIEEKTKGKIKDLIPNGALNSLTRLVLTNAIYFKANWKIQFDVKFTKKATFFVRQREEKRVDMMQMEQQLPYGETGEYQILGMPYVNDKLIMYFVLPKEKFGLKDMMTKLNAKQLLHSFDSAVQTQVEVCGRPLVLTKQPQKRSSNRNEAKVETQEPAFLAVLMKLQYDSWAANRKDPEQFILS